jgi:hypothetical protein
MRFADFGGSGYPLCAVFFRYIFLPKVFVTGAIHGA